MIRSWKVLIPLKMVVGFETVLWALEQIQWRPTPVDAGGNLRCFSMDDGG
jgi:hypothetical protein